MESATVPSIDLGMRPVWVALALAVLAGQPGCSRLKSFRQDDRPAFGTEGPATAQRTPRSSAVDLYADRVGQSQLPVDPPRGKPNPATAVGETDAPSDTEQEAVAVVSLRPPSADVNTTPTTARSGRNDGPVRNESSPPSVGAALGAVLKKSRQKLDGLTTYQVNMNHQERVGGALNPPEDVILSIRRSPRAVRLEWPSGSNQGREVIYAADGPAGGLMHVHMKNALVPRISMRPDSPLAMRNSRHPITEAGYDTIVENMERAYNLQRSGDFSLGKITYEGIGAAEGVSTRCHKVVRVTPTQETWVVYLDPVNNLPRVVQATAGNGDLLERFVFSEPSLEPETLANADAFDPDARWGPSGGGLFQRLARGNANAKPETESR